MSHPPSLSGRFLCSLLLVVTVVGGCSRSDPWDTAEFRQERLERHAQSWHLPDGPPAGRLGGANAIKCVLRESATIEVEGRPHKIVAVWASAQPKCGGLNAISLTLWDTARGGDPVVEIIGPARQFGLHPTGRCIADCGPGGGPGPVPDNTEETDCFLRKLAKIRPFGAADLPHWSTNELPPTLPPEFDVTLAADRATYEAARAQNSTTLCWKPEDTELRCIADAPRRRPSQVELFTVHAFDGFADADPPAATARMLGQGSNRQARP